MNEPRVLVIDRSKWRVGGGQFAKTFGDTSLCNAQGFMCCLGFDTLALTGMVDDVGGPYTFADKHREHLPALIDAGVLAESDRFHFNATNWTSEALTLNDDPELSPTDREARLTAHFALRNVTLRFEGEYPKEYGFA